MKNITAACAVLALFLAPSVSNARWGTEFTGSSWKMDGKEFLTSLNSVHDAAAAFPTAMTGKVTQGRVGGAASFFMEGNSRTRLGFALGYGSMPRATLRVDVPAVPFNINLESEIAYIPVDLYLKHVSEKGKFTLYGGGGADYVMASTEYKGYDGNDIKATLTQKKVVPHVQAGFELFLSKAISFNFGAKYLFSAVLDNLKGKATYGGVDQGKARLIMDSNKMSPYGDFVSLTTDPLASYERPFKYDLSGLRANVGLRIYFN